MVAIVSGNSLGLSLTSLGSLGQRGASGTSGAWGTPVQGRSGEAAYVNAATGNLVLQDRDDLLVGRGLDLGAVRTYNSQGLLADDNADNWMVGAFGQSVRLASGTAGTVGSSLARTDRDGAVAVYTWDAATARYVSPAGAGAFDGITIDASAGQFVWTDGHSARVERYESGGAGRLVSATDADGNIARFAYNANGTLQSAASANGDVSYFDYTGTDLTQVRTVSAGVTTTSYLSADVGSATQIRTTNVLQRAEGYRTGIALTTTAVVAGPAKGSTSVGGIGYLYDTNGHLMRTVDANEIKYPTHRAHTFVNDVNGNALYAYYSDDRNPGPQLNAQRQLIVNGEVLGRYGAEATQRFGNLLGPQFEAKSEFSFGYQPINGNYPAGSPGTYAVAAGDTLQSIAKGAYGDANLWYLIADANGLSSSADLRSGQVLTIPTRVASSNNANTFKPYDPSNIIGDTSPTLMAVPGHGDQGCGGVGQIIVAIVIVVVAVVSQQYYLANYATAIGTTAEGAAIYSAGSYAVAGAIGGAVGSVAGQAVGNVIGVQQGFSWKQVALGAVGGAVAGGLSGAGALSNTGSVFVDGAVRGAVSSAVTQGVAVATGLQSSFNWRNVAASAVSAGAAQGLNAALGYNPQVEFNVGKSLLTGLGGSVVGQAVRGGRIDATTLATDAFGNVLSDSLAAANSSIPRAASAEERQTIISYFNDGPGTGKNAAVDYLNSTSWSGISDTSAPMTAGQRYAGAFGGAAPNVSDRVSMALPLASDRALTGSSLQALSNEELFAKGDGLLGGFNDAELDSMHDANVLRAQGIAADDIELSNRLRVVVTGPYPANANAAESASGAWQPPATSALDAFQQGWNQQGWSMLQNGYQSQQPLSSFVYGVGQGSRQLFDRVTGAGAINQSRQAFGSGHNVRGVILGVQGLAEGVMTAATFGEYASAKLAVMTVIGARGSVVSNIAANRQAVADLGIPNRLSPRQDLHLAPVTDGRSVLSADPKELLRGLIDGNYPVLRTPKPGQAIVDFGRPIGEYWSRQSGVPQAVGPTNFGSVSFGKNGAHIIPANPKQW